MERVFFVTTVCHDRKPLFRSPRVCDLLLRTSLAYRDQKRFLLHQFVIMPDHCHFILTPAKLLSLERVMQLIKGGFSHETGKQLGRKVEIWQRSFTHQHIQSAEDYAGFQSYIHLNPVKARLCSHPAEYAYSSAHPKWARVLDSNPFTAGAKAQVAGDA